MQPCAVYGWLHPDRVKYGTEYVHADLHDATKAQLAKAVAALSSVNGITEASYPQATSAVDVMEIQRVVRAVLAEIEKGGV